MDEGKPPKGEEPSIGKATPYTNDNTFSLEQVPTLRIFGDLEYAQKKSNPGMEMDKIC